MATQEGNILQQFMKSVGNFTPASALPFGIGNTLQGLKSSGINPLPGLTQPVGQTVKNSVSEGGAFYTPYKVDFTNDTPEEIKKKTEANTQYLMQHVGFSGEMQEVPGVNPSNFKTGTSLVQDAKGNFHVNPNPQPAIYAQDTSAADQLTANPGNPIQQTQNEGTSWPQEPAKPVTPPAKKSISFLGKNDPISDVKASNAMSSSKAYSVTTPDIQDAYRRNGITDPNQVYPVRQALYDNIINPALKADTTQLPLGEVGNPKADGILPKIVAEIKRLNPALTDDEAHAAAQPFTTKLTALAQSESSSGISPTTIGLKNILDEKTLLNQSNAVQNLINGKLPDTIPDVATVATRNVLAGLVDKYAPTGISQAIKDYGLLEEGFPSYLKSASQPQPNILERALGAVKANPVGYGALGLAGSVGLPPIIKGAIGLGAATINELPKIENSVMGALGYTPKAAAQNNGGKDNKEEISHTASSIPQDSNGHYVLPQNPAISQLAPGTPAYTRAKNALPAGAPQFMANAPQAISSANNVQDDVKSGMPLNIMSLFKTSQDVQAYLSTPNQPYAKQLAHIADLNNKYLSAYQAINGTKPDASQFINPRDSKEQFMEKYNEIVSFIYNNYSQFQVPYYQTTEVPISQQQPPAGNPPSTVQYTGSLPSINPDASAIVGGNMPSVGLPAIQ